MGIDYGIRLAVGIRVDRAELERLFGKTTLERIQIEKRYDSKTGKRLPDETVVLGGLVGFEFDGEDYADETELMEALCESIGTDFSVDGILMCGEYEFIVGPSLKRGETIDHGHLEISGPCKLVDFLKASKDVERIGMELEKMDIKISAPVVIAACCIS